MVGPPGGNDLLIARFKHRWTSGAHSLRTERSDWAMRGGGATAAPLLHPPSCQTSFPRLVVCALVTWSSARQIVSPRFDPNRFDPHRFDPHTALIPLTSAGGRQVGSGFIFPSDSLRQRDGRLMVRIIGAIDPIVDPRGRGGGKGGSRGGAGGSEGS